jgi:UDP-N-acetylmuramoyl-L-alanyl-D-glutamate--2,6-diaminopimelate ligase
MGKIAASIERFGHRHLGQSPIRRSLVHHFTGGRRGPACQEPPLLARRSQKWLAGFRISCHKRSFQCHRNGHFGCGENDVVLIAGKGHETYQILADKTIHFDDRETAESLLSTLAKEGVKP